MDSYGSILPCGQLQRNFTWENLRRFQAASHGASHHRECTKAMELWKVSSSESPAKVNLDSLMASWKKTSLATWSLSTFFVALAPGCTWCRKQIWGRKKKQMEKTWKKQKNKPRQDQFFPSKELKKRNSPPTLLSRSKQTTISFGIGGGDPSRPGPRGAPLFDGSMM